MFGFFVCLFLTILEINSLWGVERKYVTVSSLILSGPGRLCSMRVLPQISTQWIRMERVFLPQTDDYPGVKINSFKPLELKHDQILLIYSLLKVTFPPFWLVFRAICARMTYYLTNKAEISIA